MKLYLQKCYENSFMVTRLLPSLPGYPIDYFGYDILEFDIDGRTPIIEIYNLVVEKYGCKKLVLDF